MLTVEDWAEIRRLHRAEGMPIKAIARTLGISRNTVRAALASDGPPRYERQPAGSAVDAFEPRIRELLQAYPTMPATVIAERVGWERGLTVLKDRVRELRPAYLPPDPAQPDRLRSGRARAVRLLVPAGHGPGRVRAGARRGAAAGADDGHRVLAVAVGGAGPVAARRGPVRGLVAADRRRLGAVPRALVWDGEGAIGRWRAGKPELTGGVPGVPRHARAPGWWSASPADPEAKGLVERANGYLETSFLPGRRFASPADFNAQLAEWPRRSNGRVRRALGCAPADRIAADRAGDAGACRRWPRRPGGGPRPGCRRDHYVRLDSNDYSVHPAVIGRRMEVVAGLDRVRACCGGQVVADHERFWAWHQTITDPEHKAAAAGAAAAAGRRAAARRPGAGGRAAQPGRLRRRWPAATARGPPDARREERPVTWTAELAFLTRALKAPTLRDSVDRLAERARAESWTHEEFLVACLQREVAARESHGGEGRIRAARFPARKSLEEFDFDHARGLKRDTIAHLGTLDFIAEKGNVVFLGPPGTGKTHLATGIAIRACQAGHRVQFATASQWVDRLADRPRRRQAAGRARPGWAATRSWSSTRSATSRSSPRPPTCSSSSSPAATSGPASSSPATSHSAAGARSSATTPSPPP